LLLKYNCQVYIAGSGDSLLLLQKEFPQLTAFSLPAYKPEYPAGGSMVLKMMMQLPRFIRVIRDEHHAVEEIIAREEIDVVISDNRYGCWSSKAKSVFITHQSNIRMPARFGWLAHFVRNANHRMMRKFSVCWIPDRPGDESIAGDLISFGTFDDTIAHAYIGSLSRFIPSGKRVLQYDLICVFSGPEPQRTIFENIVVQQVNRTTLKTLIVRGLPGDVPAAELDTHATVVPFMNSEALQQAIESSACILARSGFSTVMDLIRLGGHVIFIPTPGQTEQEYLAQRLLQKGIAYSTTQSIFDLPTALEKAKQLNGFTPIKEDSHLLEEAVTSILQA
jgi:UDP-N-acetylglucosamine transferase subunit ALG13